MGNRLTERHRPQLVKRLTVALMALALGALSCGDQNPTAEPAGPADDLHGRTFLSTTVTEGGRPRQLAPGTRVSLWFADDGRLVASAGCNTLGGQIRLDGGRIDTSGDLSMTGMGCDVPRHAQDEWLAKVLEAKPSWRLEGERLVVTSGDTELVLLDRKVAEPDLTLEGTRWTLETIFLGDTASSVAGGEAAYLVFAGGRVTGSTGCNTLQGPATVSGSTIRFGEIGVTRKACPADLAEVERAVVAVLRGEVTFTIEADHLTLNPGGAQGLGLRGDR